MKLAYVQWNDACEHESAHIDERSPTTLVHSAGFLVYEDVHHVELAFYYNHSENKYEPVLAIPRAMIISIERFND